MYQDQDITETMLGLLGNRNIFQSICFCFDIGIGVATYNNKMNIWLTLQEQGVVPGSAGQTAAAAVMILNTTLAKVTAKGHYGIWVSSRDIT